MIRCLEENRQHLEDDCKDASFYRMARMSEDIDFNKPLKDACTFEIKENCGKVDPGQSRVVRCLQDGKRKSYSDKCKEVRTVLPWSARTCPLRMLCGLCAIQVGSQRGTPGLCEGSCARAACPCLCIHCFSL